MKWHFQPVLQTSLGTSIFLAATIACLAAEPSANLLDLAHAYRETELFFDKNPPANDEGKAFLQRGMDRVAFSFFSKNYPEAIQGMHELVMRNAPHSPMEDSDCAAISLKLVTIPNEITVADVRGSMDDSPLPFSMRCLGLYVPKLVGRVDATLELRFLPREEGKPIVVPLEIELDPGESVAVPMPDRCMRQLLKELPAREQRIDCEVFAPSGIRIRLTPFDVLNRNRGEEVAALQSRLDTLRDRQPPIDLNALRLLESRIVPLTSDTPKDHLNRWILGTTSLTHEVDSQLTSMESGGNPFQNPPGDTWLTLQLDKVDVPCRIYRPAKLSAVPGERFPVVIALHGAGGNEHMFFETLGAGKLKRLADDYGFLAVSPATVPIVTHQQIFPDFIEQLAALYPIDQSRVWVMGHSMGAFTATQLGSLYPDRIQKLALIAGGPRWGLLKKSFPPTRVYLPEFDAIVPPDSIRKGVKGCQRAGLPIGVVDVPACGHVLAVAEVLGAVIAWFHQDS